MAKAIPNPDAAPNGPAHAQLLQQFAADRAARHLQAPAGAPRHSHLDFWGQGNPLEGEAGQDQELMRTLGIAEPPGHAADPAPAPDSLLAENMELREIIAELKGQLEQAGQQVEAAGAERLKEAEAMIEEKSEIIRELHAKIQELEARPLTPPTPKEEELIALSEELERERCQLQQECRQLEEDRKQFEEDEQIMTQQMREMEVQMARERADFARQRSELNRIQEEVRREVENIERNGLLNQRLGQLRQRSMDLSTSRGNGQANGHPEAPGADPEGAPPPPAHDGAESRRRESFLGRLFG